MTEFGPMQILVVGFDGPPTGKVAPVLADLREQGTIRLVDMIFVTKDDAGEITAVETSDLSQDESTQLGAIAGALIGIGAAGEEGAEAGALAGAEAGEDGITPLGDDVWYVADAIPPGTSAAVAIIEHQWAIPLRDAVRDSGGRMLADSWLHPEDLVEFGAHLAEPGV